MSTSTVQQTAETVEQQARAALTAFLTQHGLKVHQAFQINWRPARAFERAPELAALIGPTGHVPNTIDAYLAAREQVLAAGKALGVEVTLRTYVDDEQAAAWYVYRSEQIEIENWLPGVTLQLRHSERRTARPDRAPRRRRAS